MKVRKYCLLFIMILSGCHLWEEKYFVPQISLDIKAEKNINLNQDGKYTPIILRVYQLSNDQVFLQSDFIQLYYHDQDILKTDLLSLRVLPAIYPNSEQKYIYPLVDGVKYIGVLAEFSQYHQASNKRIIAPIIIGSTIVKIKLDGQNLSLSTLGE